MGEQQKAKAERKKEKIKFTQSIKTFDALSSGNNLESITASFTKISGHFDKIVEIQDDLISLVIDENPEADVTELESYSDAVRTTFIEKSEKLDQCKARIENEKKKDKDSDGGNQDSEGEEQETSANALVNILNRLTVIAEKKETKNGDSNEKKDIISNSFTNVRLEGLKPPIWNGEEKEYYSWKRLFMGAMKEAKQTSDQVIISRMVSTIPDTWKSKIQLCNSLDGVWKEFEQVITKERVQELVYKDFKRLRKIRDLSENEIREFVEGLRLFVRRMTDLNKEAETKTDSTLSDARFKIGETLNLNYSNFTSLRNETPTLDSLIEYLSREATIRGQSAHQSKPGGPSGGKFREERGGPGNGYGSQSGLKRFNNFQGGQSSSQSNRCQLGCSTSHPLAECQNFLKKSVSERVAWVRENTCCFNCLKGGHRAGDCRSTLRCEKCKKKHHVTLHWNTEVDRNGQSGQEPSLNPNAQPFKRYHHLKKEEQSEDEGTILPIVEVEVLDKSSRPQRGIALLDRGSDSSLIREDFAEKLGLSGKDIELSYGTAGGDRKREKSKIINIQLASSDLSSGLYPLEVYSMKQPCHDVRKLSSKFFERNPHLEPYKDKVFVEGGRVDLLIGSDHVNLIRDRDCRESETDQNTKPIAVKCLLGWYITGPKGKPSPKSSFHNITVQTFTKLEEQHAEIERMIQSDILGVKAGTKLCVCSENELSKSAFIKQVKENTEVLPEGRIKVRIPWKEGFPGKLCNNRERAEKQLEKRSRQLQRDGEFEEYDREIQALLEREVVRTVQPEEIQEEESAWYLNHRGIKRPDKESTKIRIVFDSAAEYKGYSLNDAIEMGPNYMNSLFTCLIGWREEQVAVVGDISKMFNQIVLHEEDQKFHRFLWKDKVYQWLRVPFGDKSSPDLANYCIKLLAEQNKEKYPQAYDVLSERIYVDDVTSSTETKEEANRVMSEIEKVLEQGSFPIKVWHSNEKSVDRAPTEKVTDVLGLCWDKRDDKFFLKHKEIVEFKEVAKRTVLSLVAKFWDPLGMLTPCLIKYRIALQEIWASGVGWDEEVSVEESEKWKEYRKEMIDLFEISHDRCMKPENAVGKPQLHGFSDGGVLAFGTCIFLRWELTNGQFTCKFVASKAFVAPLKRRSIPRLELMGCVGMTRLVKSVEDSLRTEFEKKVLWVDSTTVLTWLKSPPRIYKPFVGARVAEIQETHDVGCFRYVPSELNHADQLTKPIPMRKLSDWHLGPEYLKLSEEKWPENRKSSSEDLESEAECQKELNPKDSQKRKKYGKIHVVMTTDDVEEDAERLINALLSCESWEKAEEKIAERTRNLRKDNEKKVEGPYSVTELENAKIKIYKLIQADEDFSDRKYQDLNPKIDERDGLYKSSSRLKSEHLSEKIRFPVILPKKSNLNRLIAKHYHEKTTHAGYRRVKSQIQNNGLWMCGVRDLLKSVAARCEFCRVRRRPVLGQMMGQLPDFRVEPHVKPFQNCAMDFFGPLKIKYGGRSTIEGHVCIMTCMVTRAIHLELCTDASTEKFLLAWRRFASTRGVHCKTVWSDNGGNFVGAVEPLRKMIREWDENRIKSDLSKNQTEFDWKFNTPYASHMNGVVESLINSVRKALDAICGIHDVSYTYEEWITFLQEVTYVVNSRPLFPDGEDPVDSPSVTPNSILHGHGIEVPQQIIDTEERVNPRDRYRTIQKQIQIFWENWMRFMPPQLLRRTKWFRTRDNLQVGDLVLLTKTGLKGQYAPRATWERALVTAVHPGDDGLVRKVTVRTSDKSEYDRPIHKMSLLATKEELKEGLKD